MKPNFIIIAVALAVSAFFTATQPITPALAVVSSVAVVLFALPSYRAVLLRQGWRRGAVLLVVLGLYAVIIESSAIHTGFPYGSFVYTDVLGNKVFGLTPWTVAFAYPPILLLAYWFARSMKLSSDWRLYAVIALTATAIDLVLDPAAVRLGFWYWDSPGVYYGVPVVNFLGWLLSASVGGMLLHRLWGSKNAVPVAVAYSGFATLWFWTAANLWLQQWLPAIIGIVISTIIFRNMKQKSVQ